MTTYRLSFTAADLMVNETSQVGSLWLQSKDWSEVSERIYEDNIIPKPTRSAIARIFREIRLRLEALNEHECSVLTAGDYRTKIQMVFLSCLRTYPILFDFCNEVIVNKFLERKLNLTDRDFHDFVEAKSLLHSELAALSPSTLSKIKQLMFRMLAQVEILADLKSKELQRIHPSNDMMTVLRDEPRSVQQIFGYHT